MPWEDCGIAFASQGDSETPEIGRLEVSTRFGELRHDAVESGRGEAKVVGLRHEK